MKNRLTAIALLILALSSGTAALAQENTTSAPAESAPTYCLFNGREFSEGAELCMRKGRSGSCFHGNWSTSSDENCEGADHS